MALEDDITNLRKTMDNGDIPQLSDTVQGISKERIREALNKIDLATDDQVDAVYALLDDTRPSWFGPVSKVYKFSDGASTAHIACHIGILQRGKRKLDREGRDYWLKPMWQIEAIEKITLDSKSKEFLPGHLKAKSPNSAYRISNEFREILKAPNTEWEALLIDWIQEDKLRQRRELQAKLAAQALVRVDSSHSDLIRSSHENYCKRYFPGYEVIYIDDGDGDRITDTDRRKLESAGITITLDDAMPDILLWNKEEESLWVIEAVTSDGEVDYHKINQLTKLSVRSGKKHIGFTTTYRTWRDCAVRQQKHKNIAVDTYIWIEEDPSKHFHVESF